MNIVERLRHAGDHASFEPNLHHDAADQIEKLTRELAVARSKFMQERDHWLRLRDDNSRLLRVIEHLMKGNRFEEVREDLNALLRQENGA